MLAYSVQASLIIVAAFISPGLSVDPLVDLTYSQYDGQPLLNGITQWLGIRYAAPPVGNLRFEPPQDPLFVAGIQPANQVSNYVYLKRWSRCNYHADWHLVETSTVKSVSELETPQTTPRVPKTASSSTFTRQPTPRSNPISPYSSSSKAGDSTATRRRT